MWERFKKIGRKRLIAGALTVGLAAAGVALPPEVIHAIVTAADVVIEST